ncbi:MAG: hypothetical protein N2Z40_06935 [Caldimicrobium sp.]|nr:hypothetical protein [Caldimicrobium sp.]MCX7613936.1 hypothetical protein [Caldimicrobium sp.]MDW8182019.1 hypothetical protein [Caldimicrobium sp.]
MPLASGFLEIMDQKFIENVVRVLEEKNIEVITIEDNKVIYLVEGGTLPEVEEKVKFMKSIEGVLNVYLAYYSLE